MTDETQIDTTDINELFNRDPLKLTSPDIGKIIAEYRRKRHLFISAPSGAKRPAAAAKKTPAQQAAAKLDINIDLKL
tara:strand:- start:2299 stop:2529 length:231 start_codon:yes stop_codon:yes gene_type:complete